MRTLSERLKVAKAEHKIRLKEFNTAQRNLHKVLVEINTLEQRIALKKEPNAVAPT
jgi:hypothetical protein